MLNVARNLLIMLKILSEYVFKTASKRAIQKTAEATGDLTDNKIVNVITTVSKHSQINK